MIYNACRHLNVLSCSFAPLITQSLHCVIKDQPTNVLWWIYGIQVIHERKYFEYWTISFECILT